jgi:hypothetical protein
MNERLRQFERESKLEIFGLGAKRIPWEAALEKFAELIVKETMQVVANHLPSNQYLDVAHAVIEHYKDNDVT